MAAQISSVLRLCAKPGFLLRQTRTHRRLISTQPIPIKNTVAHDALQRLFDNTTVWKQYKQFLPSSVIEGRSFGLLGNQNFVDEEGFQYAVKQAIQEAETIVQRIWNAPENGPEEMRRVVKNLDRLSNTICSVVDISELLRNAHPDPVIMEAANRAYTDLCTYMNRLNIDTRLHEVLVKVLADPLIVASFSSDEHAAALVFLEDFKKSCIHLPSKQRSQFVELSDEVIQLGREFIQCNPRSVHKIRFDRSALAGVNPTAFKLYKHRDGYVYLPTNPDECQMVLRNANSADVRRQVYEATNSATHKSIEILEALMKTRSKIAALVGQKSFAELHLKDKMAKNPKNVQVFLNTLFQHQKPDVEKDLLVLQQAMQQKLKAKSLPQLNAWDKDYYMGIATLSQNTGAYNPRINPRFSLGSVMQGLSSLLTHLYGVQLEPAQIAPGEVWDSGVRKLNVVCEREGHIGTIYCDLYSRPEKTTSAAHYTIKTSRRVDNDDQENDIRYAFPGQTTSIEMLQSPSAPQQRTVRGRQGLFQLPIIVLTCDFANPKHSGGPSLLSTDEVETLFHEMGHAIHSMMALTEFHSVAGTRCATDFVELPSILMQHFVWHPSVFPLFSKDPQTGNVISEKDIKAHLQRRKKFSGIEVNSQIIMAMLDQRYHSELASETNFSSVKIWHSLQDEFSAFPSVPRTMWPVQFGHLFGYGAGYYSYLFDQTLAHRVWETCFSENPLDREKGLAFREKLLQWGGAQDPWKCVADVLGGEDGERIAAGDELAMKTVGDWGVHI
ncbi:hypothetical protein BDF14DRAFT_1727658 [Spinellus fusiger]|nr:hypothetical protein BDF14DRAFT_1727658 [Spinellus fusiger]